MNKLSIIIQARSGSTRLPNKVLRAFHGKKSILELLLERLKNAFAGQTIVLATSNLKADDSIEELGKEMGVAVYRGDEQNVLKRFIGAAKYSGATEVIRVCSDNPFFNNTGVQKLIDADKNESDYLSFCLPDKTPIIKSHLGLYGEWVRVDALEKALKLTNDSFYHEHVTNFIYGNPKIFKSSWLDLPFYHPNPERLRFTLDDASDFELHQQIYKALGQEAQNTRKLFTFAEENGLLTVMQKQIAKYTK